MSGKSQKRELYGETQTILASSPATNQAEVPVAQNVMLDQIDAIERNRFKSHPLRGREKLTQRHRKLYLLPASAAVRASSREIVAA
jgi:hypothetical protein